MKRVSKKKIANATTVAGRRVTEYALVVSIVVLLGMAAMYALADSCANAMRTISLALNGSM